MKMKIAGMLAASLLAGPIAASASVIYTLTSIQGTFSYTAPTFVTSEVLQCDANGSLLCGPSLNLRPDSSAYTGTGTDTLDIASIGFKSAFTAADIAFAFANGTFGQTGTFASVATSAAATMTIRELTSVPEPGTLGLFGLAFVGLSLTRRRQA